MALALVLLRLEVTRAGVSELLANGAGWPFWTVFLITLLWLSQAYLYPGHLLGGDTLSHVVRAVHFGRTLASGALPVWDKDFYLGVPLLQFYPPLFAWLTGGLYALIGDAALTPKLVLLAANLTGAIGMFCWMRALQLSRFAGMVGGCVYIGSWGHGHLLLYQGALPVALIMALLPLCFLAIERLLSPNGANSRIAALLALCVALLFYAHQAHAFIAGIYLALYSMARWAMLRRSAGAFLLLLAAATLGIVAAISTIVPYLAEQHWVVASAGARPPSLTWPTRQYLGWLIAWGNTRTTFGADSAAYLGYSALALACAGCLLFRCHGRWRVLLLLLSLFLLSLSLRGLLVRDIALTVLFLSPLAALGAEGLIRLRYAHMPAAIFALLLLDLGIVAVQPLARTDKEHQVVAGQIMAERYRNANILLAGVSGDGQLDMIVGPMGSLPALAEVATLGGPHNHGATPVHNYLVAAAEQAERDLNRDGRLGSDTITLLAAFDIAAVVGFGSRSVGLPERIAEARPLPGLGRVLEIEQHAPVIFSERLVAIDSAELPDRPIVWDDGFWQAENSLRESIFATIAFILKASDYSPGEKTAAALVIRDSLPAGQQGPKLDVGPSPQPILLERWEAADTGSTLVVRSARAGWLQIAHPWYPSVAVFLNGKRVVALQSALGLMVVPVEAGDNAYQLEPRLSVLRQSANAISVTALTLIGLGILRKSRVK